MARRKAYSRRKMYSRRKRSNPRARRAHSGSTKGSKRPKPRPEFEGAWIPESEIVKAVPELGEEWAEAWVPRAEKKIEAEKPKIPGPPRLKLGGGFGRGVKIAIIAVVAVAVIGLAIWMLIPEEEKVMTEEEMQQYIESSGEHFDNVRGTFTCTVTNKGEKEAEIKVSYYPEGRKEDNVTRFFGRLAPGETRRVELVVERLVPGTYVFELPGGDKRSYTVLELGPARIEVVSFTVAPERLVLDPEIGADEIKITAVVQNKGEEAGSKTIRLELERKYEREELLTKRVSLAPLEMRTVEFIYPIYPYELDGLEPGEWKEFKFIVERESKTVKVTGVAEFETSITSVKAEASGPGGELLVGDLVVISFKVLNTGTMKGRHRVWLCIGGSDVGSKEYEIARGDYVKDNFSWRPPAKGTYTIEVDEQRYEKTLEVLNPAKFELIEPLEVKPSKLLTEEQYQVTATIRNSGDVKGQCAIELWVDGKRVETDEVWILGGEFETKSFKRKCKNIPGAEEVKIKVKVGTEVIGSVDKAISITGKLRELCTDPPDKWEYTAGRTDEYKGPELVDGITTAKFYGIWTEKGTRTHTRYWVYKPAEGEVYDVQQNFKLGTLESIIKHANPLKMFEWPIPTTPKELKHSGATVEYLKAQARDASKSEVIETAEGSDLTEDVVFTLEGIKSDDDWGEYVLISFSYDLSGTVTVTGVVEKKEGTLLGSGSWEATEEIATKTAKEFKCTIYGTIWFSRRYGVIYLEYSTGSELKAQWYEEVTKCSLLCAVKSTTSYRVLVEVPMATQTFKLVNASFAE